MKSFENKIAVVTGGGSGMGRELVLQLAEAGCHVAFCDLSEEAMAQTMALCEPVRASGTRLSSHRCDVSSEDDLRALQQAVAQQHDTDHINLLFNNAGVSGGQSFIRDERENWDKTFAICWGGVYLGCRVFMPMLMASEEAHIVNISSVNGFWACLGTDMEHTAYSAAKFAVKGFSEALMIDTRVNAPHVKVSVVMPGHIGTDIAMNTHRMWDGEYADMDAVTAERIRERMVRFDPAAASLSDKDIMEQARSSGEGFRDNAPTSAAQASAAILAGVREERWRILIGDDAIALDQAVRADPEKAYDAGFFAFLEAGL